MEDDESEVPDALRAYLFEACSEIGEFEKRMESVEHQLKALAKELPEVQRLLTIPGIRLLTATAIVGFVGELGRFRSGRRFASYLGLVPKESSSGDIRRLGRITKRGDTYLRMLLPHGARAVLWAYGTRPLVRRNPVAALNTDDTNTYPLANAWIRMRHSDYDELRRMLNRVGETVKVRAE